MNAVRYAVACPVLAKNPGGCPYFAEPTSSSNTKHTSLAYHIFSFAVQRTSLPLLLVPIANARHELFDL